MITVYLLGITFLVELSSSSSLGQHYEIPDYVKICKQSDPNINECIMSAVESVRPMLITGSSQLGVPSIEPLNIGTLVLWEKDKHGYLLNVENVIVNGAGNFKLKKLRTKNHIQNIDAEIMLPKLHIEGQYNVNGQFLSLPVKGNGKFTGNFTNAIGYVKIVGELIEIDDEKRYSVKKLNINVKIDKGKLMVTNLFGGDKILNTVINNAINDHFDILANELIPPIEKELSKKFILVANSFLHKFTFMQLFPQ